MLSPNFRKWLLALHDRQRNAIPLLIPTNGAEGHRPIHKGLPCTCREFKHRKELVGEFARGGEDPATARVDELRKRWEGPSDNRKAAAEHIDNFHR